ncbi:hypothetical protein GCM10011297_18050 [Bacterioplanes sanyensis]|uniref:S8 family serine peptidase n=1 Tax=Bacterioplanes sanyensis TaxID=1249553 RepID=UPI0016729F48|nr:S8 family serine peptidase [Bacterioplanes sanyensis]GGY45701.1 hypothetical protein GCM10011297_18050 [Bacterioplanes sanyensis]
MIALSGTSQAAAITSAGLAKLWSVHADVSRHELIDAVMNTTQSPDAANTVGMGNGLVNFGAAHQRLQDPSSQPLCQPSWYINKNYQAGEQVIFAGEQYIAIAANQQTIPESSDSWQWTGSYDAPQQERWGHIALGGDDYQLQRGEKCKYNSLCSSYLASCSSSGSSFGNLPTVYANVPAILDSSSTLAGSWNHFDGVQFAMTDLLKLGGSGAVRTSLGVGSGSLGTAVANKALKQFGRTIDDLSSAASKKLKNTDLTVSARALDKHAAGQRSSGTFLPLSGNAAVRNK